MDLDLAAGTAPKWSTHSLRRLADTTARRYREETNTTEAEIDIYFGWNERMLKKAMQVRILDLQVTYGRAMLLDIFVACCSALPQNFCFLLRAPNAALEPFNKL